MFKILESFYSIQGEGISSGTPAYFIRFPGCDLTCSFCDTKEVMKTSKVATIDSIVKDIKVNNQLENVLNGVTHIVFTGGEPTLDYNKKEIVNLLEHFKKLYPNNKIYSEIETNGTRVLEPSFYDFYIQQINCSPKLENSHTSIDKRFNPYALRQINSHYNSWFKFVVSNEKDIDEIRHTYLINPEYGQIISPYKIILMPESESRETLGEATKLVYELAMKYGVKATTRGHILAWDRRKGV